jgi:hypothetical protein
MKFYPRFRCCECWSVGIVLCMGDLYYLNKMQGNTIKIKIFKMFYVSVYFGNLSEKIHGSTKSEKNNG